MQGRCPNGYDGVLTESLPQVTWPEIRTLIERVVSDAEANAARLLRTFHVTILRGSGSFLVDWLAIGGHAGVVTTGYMEVWGYPQVIQVMDDHDLVLTPMVTWGFPF